MLTSLKRAGQKGFTIIELLIVIAIIVILAGLVLTNIQGAQAKARDATRLGDINSMFTALEAFHGDNNYYPQTFDNNSLTGVEDGALTDPRGSNSIEILAAVADEAAATTAVQAAANDDTATSSAYVYAAYPTGCSNDCTGYVIGTFTEQTQEDGNNYFVKSSLNN